MKQLFVLTIRDSIHLTKNLASGTLEDVQTGQESSFQSAMELLTLLERIVAIARSNEDR